MALLKEKNETYLPPYTNRMPDVHPHTLSIGIHDPRARLWDRVQSLDPQGS